MACFWRNHTFNYLDPASQALEPLLSHVQGQSESGWRSKTMNSKKFFLTTLPLTMTLAAPVFAQQDEDLAKQLANPIADLISVPFQFNYDSDYGPDEEGHRYVMNLQPVVPLTLNKDWNVISRTIIPLISQKDILPGSGSKGGLGDITQSFFFSPSRPTAGGMTWGIGPVLLLPSGTDAQLSSRKWGAGPTAVALKQQGAWTYGLLANHVWSFGGSDSRPDISSTFVQPFLSYTTKDAWTFGVNTESTYDRKNKEWSVPVNFTASKLTKFGNQPVSVGGGLRYWADSPDSGPHGWGVRLTLTFLFPK